MQDKKNDSTASSKWVLLADIGHVKSKEVFTVEVETQDIIDNYYEFLTYLD